MQIPSPIGLLAPAWPPDVATSATVAESLARVLLATGQRPVVLAVERDPRRCPYVTRETLAGNVPVRRLTLPDRAPASTVGPLRIAAAVRAWLADARPQLVHLFDPGSLGVAAVEELVRYDRPVVASLDEYTLLCPRRRLLTPRGERCPAPSAARCAECLASTWLGVAADAADTGRRTSRALAALRGLDRLLVPSRAALETWVRAGLERSRLELCPPGLESQTLRVEFALARRALEGGRHLGILGATRPSAGVVEMAHAVCLANRPRLTLEVHGPLVDSHGDATYLNALQRLAEFEPRIRLHGPYERRDLPRVLATLDAVAAPARWEASVALGVREARAVGMPVLASRHGVHLELAEDPGLTLVDDGVEAWAEVLKSCDFAPTAPAPVRSLLSYGEQVLKTYRGVLTGAPATPRAGAPPWPASRGR